jgi:TolA-binding protein
MTNEQQFTLTVSIFSIVFTFTGALAAIIFNGFKKTQDSHSDKLQDHGEQLVKIKEQQYLKIEQLEERFDELKSEVHELRKELKQQITNENEVLRNMLAAMQRVEQSLRHNA